MNDLDFLNRMQEIDHNFSIISDYETSNKIVETKYGVYYISGTFNEVALLNCLIHFKAKQLLYFETKNADI